MKPGSGGGVDVDIRGADSSGSCGGDIMKEECGFSSRSPPRFASLRRSLLERRRTALGGEESRKSDSGSSLLHSGTSAIAL